jgi:HD-GYP domain-containing protein (c-di-GMP phosphodiesterase class II)
MRSHAAHTEAILLRVAAFGDLAAVAGAHHERLDGKGYPKGLKGAEIALETRIITAADIFDALTADRPYRAAMPVTKALAIMSEMVDTAIDRRCYDALCRAMDRLERQKAA